MVLGVVKPETWLAVLGAWEVLRIQLVSARLQRVRKGLEED